MDEDFTYISHETIKEQNPLYLLETASYASPEHDLLADLQLYYAPGDHDAALQRVWHRFLAQQNSPVHGIVSPSARIIHLARRRKYRRFRQHMASLKPTRIAGYLSLAALFVAAALSLGRLLHMLARNNKHIARSGLLPTT